MAMLIQELDGQWCPHFASAAFSYNVSDTIIQNLHNHPFGWWLPAAGFVNMEPTHTHAIKYSTMKASQGRQADGDLMATCVRRESCCSRYHDEGSINVMWGYWKAHNLDPGTNLIRHHFKLLGLPEWIPEEQEVVRSAFATLHHQFGQYKECDFSDMHAATIGINRSAIIRFSKLHTGL